MRIFISLSNAKKVVIRWAYPKVSGKPPVPTIVKYPERYKSELADLAYSGHNWEAQSLARRRLSDNGPMVFQLFPFKEEDIKIVIAKLRKLGYIVDYVDDRNSLPSDSDLVDDALIQDYWPESRISVPKAIKWLYTNRCQVMTELEQKFVRGVDFLAKKSLKEEHKNLLVRLLKKYNAPIQALTA